MEKATHHFHFKAIDSTNTWAKNNPHLWNEEGITVVDAESQFGGRGRQGRRWLAPPRQNITCSFCFFIDVQQTGVQHLAQIMAVSAAKVLEKAGFFPALKWPNDLLLKGKKVGGILCETVQVDKKLGIVAGIGINVNMAQEDLDAIDQPATSLMVLGDRTFDVKALSEELALQFKEDLHRFLKEGFGAFLEDYTKRLCYERGAAIHVREKDHVWEGNFEGLNNDGSLSVVLKTGEKKHFFSGDVEESSSLK